MGIRSGEATLSFFSSFLEGKQLCHFFPPFSRGSNFVIFFLLSRWVSNTKGKELLLLEQFLSFNSIALRKVRIVYSLGLSECIRVKKQPHFGRALLSMERKRKSQKLFPCSENGRKT